MEEKKETLHFGVLGKTLMHSLSPEIHLELFPYLGIYGTYQKYEMNEQEVLHILDYMKMHKMTGMNVTIPYKETLYHMVDVKDIHSQRIGAINTIYYKNGKFYGYNTDYLGALSMLKRAKITAQNKKIVILGSGGAAKALIYGFLLAGAKKITVAARNESSKLQLKTCFPSIDCCDLNHIPDGDIIVNTTPVGMYPNVKFSPVSRAVLKNFSIAVDIVYNPLITTFLKEAKEEGLTIVTGLSMLIDQGIASEEIWLNEKIDYHLGDMIHKKLEKHFL